LLGSFPHGCGFAAVRRVENFGLFDDTCRLRFRGVPISIDLIAEKPTPDPA
jgi:hypothetical protein